MIKTTTAIDETTRRLLVASPAGVLILGQRRRLVGQALAWVIVGCHLVYPADVPRCADDVRAAFAAAKES